MRKIMIIMGASSLALGGCATNNAVEGGVAGGLAGGAIAVITGRDVSTGVAVGAAAGAAAGYFVDKDNGCSGYDDRGRLDDDCYGRDGYPDRRPR